MVTTYLVTRRRKLEISGGKGNTELCDTSNKGIANYTLDTGDWQTSVINCKIYW
jgi:hypothetical protein